MNVEFWMGFRFANYDVNELAKCGQEFEREFTSCALSSTFARREHSSPMRIRMVSTFCHSSANASSEPISK